MKYLVALAVICLSLNALSDDPSVDEQAPGVTVVADSIHVAGSGYKGELIQGTLFFGPAPPYTRLGLVVLRPEGGLIRVRYEESEITSLTDDCGTDLLDKNRPHTFFPCESEFAQEVNPDGTALALRVLVPRIAAPGARQLTVVGKLAVDVGTRQETLQYQSVPLIEGQKLNAWPWPYEIRAVGPLDWKDYKVRIELAGQTDLSELIDVEFFDEKGNRIGSEQQGRGWSKRGDKITGSKTYALAKAVDAATVKITYWEASTRLVIPFQINVCLGLGQAEPKLADVPEPEGQATSRLPDGGEVRVGELCVTDTIDREARNLMVGREGTYVFIHVVLPDKQIMHIDRARSEISAFVDDAGTDLVAKPGAFSFDKDLHADTTVSTDRKAISLELYLDALPDKCATRIRVAGTLAILTGTKRSVARHKDVPLRKGTTFVAGPVNFRIDDVSLDEAGNQRIALSVTGKVIALEEVSLFDAQGRQVTVLHCEDTDQETEHVLKGILAERMDVANVEVAFWPDREEVMVPFDVTTGLGLVHPTERADPDAAE